MKKKVLQKPKPARLNVQPASKAISVYIIGDSPLVEEFARLCAEHKYAVIAAWNSPTQHKPDFGSLPIKSSSAIPKDIAVGIELTTADGETKRASLMKLDQALPPTAPILSLSTCVTATEQSSWIVQKHRLVGFGMLSTFINKPLVEVAPTVFSPTATMEVVERFFRSVGKEIELVQDRIGLVTPRIVCQLINEAAFALQEEIASPQDIDTAMKLGVNYPFGPIEWLDKIGAGTVVNILDALHHDLGDDRYRVAPILRQMALSGAWWKKP